ncbi:MAG TPA: hypothetical protein VI072_06655 [Polyangiaceae bacterium]
MTSHVLLRASLAVFACAVTACGGGESSDRRREPPAPFRVEIHDETLRKILPAARGVLAFREPTGGALTEHWVERSLAWFDEAGAPLAELRAPASELFVDAVTHPSGEATLFLAGPDGCSLRRYSAAGTPLGTSRVDEPDLVTDPTDVTEQPIIPWNVGACQPTEIRETGRLAADGEHVYLVNRGGSSGTLLFRYAYEGGAFLRTLRVPLFPRHAAPLPTGIAASHRVLRSTHWSFIPRVSVDDAGRARVLFVLGSGAAVDVYNRFAATRVADTAAAVILTVDKDGAISGTRELARGLVWPGHVAEVEAFRWLRGGVVLTGRVAPAPLPDDGRGWNGFLLHWVDGAEAPQLAVHLDVDGGDAFSDVASAGSGWVVAGRSGYWQNPRGASISEEARSELLALDASGRLIRRADLPQGLRHNAALSLTESSSSGHFFVGGLTNGPGSHSADSDPALLRADGWLERIVLK